MTLLNRRCLLLAIVLVANLAAGTAMADDDDSDSGSDNSGSGSSNSGSGSGNSGGGDDDDDDDDSGDDDNDGRSSNGRKEDDHERAIKAVKQGKAVSLKKLKEHLAARYPGKILDVRLHKRSGDYFYNVRILAKGNRLKVLSLNALTLKPKGN